MVRISAKIVAELRAKTDAPIMQCKKALIQANGDMDKAKELLYVSLGNRAINTSSRVTGEGLIASFIGRNIGTTRSIGSLVELNCETDFVAKNDSFITFSKTIAELISTKNPNDVSALSMLSINDKTIDEVRLIMSGKIGENILIRRFVRLETENKLVTYLHGNRIGVIVEYKGGDDQVGKDIAMHIAAMKPVFLSPNDVPTELIQKERLFAEQKAAKSRKSPEISKMMINGSIQKYIKEISLLTQTFIKNDKQTIEQMLKATNTTVYRFVMFVVGEEIEKRYEDSSDEVAGKICAVK
ncbi:MAG: translation elongation factor Ts [Burkholderia sp.]|nr:translation elongation factor Ts [Burkholderia sp.]